MITELPNIMLALPEMFVLGMACVVLMVDLFLQERQRGFSYVLSQATLVGAAAITIAIADTELHLSFNDAFVLDPMASLLKVSVYAITFGVFLYSREYLRERALFKGEYYVLGLFGVLGMMVMISGHSFLT